MHTDADIIQWLHERFPGQSAEQVIFSLIRVPEAWDYLGRHLADESIQDALSAEDLHPANLAVLVLRAENDVSEASITIDSSPDAEYAEAFPALAHAALTFAAEVNREEERESALAAVNLSPDLRSLLALAFTRIERPGELILRSFEADDRRMIQAWMNALLVNMTPEQAAQWAVQQTPQVAGEIAMAMRLQKGAPLVQPASHDADKATGKDALSASQQLLAFGLHDEARSLLQSAWQQLSEQIASVADRIAEVSGFEQDTLTMAEARRQAMEIHPSPGRRAEWILALLEDQKLEQAIGQTQGTPETAEEQIAYGLVALASGNVDQALTFLGAAARQVNDVDAFSPRWLRLLADALRTAGAVQDALTVYRQLAARFPTDSKVRERYAALLYDAGGYKAASDEAIIASAIDPSANNPKIILAQSLEAICEFKPALAMWQQVAKANPDYAPKLAECAFKSSDMHLAETASSQMLTGDVEQKSKAHVLLGRIAHAREESEQARIHFAKALDLDPGNASAWLALSESKAAVGDHEAAAKTLAAAVQEHPDQPALHKAFSNRLHRQGRLTEALEELQFAARLSGDDADVLLQKGKTLLELGRTDEALEALRHAWEKKPLSWQVRHALALAYEKTEELALAVKLVEDLPEHASAEAMMDAGRIQAKAVHAAPSRGPLAALSQLEQAAAKGADPARILYWKGYAAEQAGLFNQALQRYADSLEAASADRIAHLDALLGYGRAATQMDRPSLALERLNEARQQFPTSTDLLKMLSSLYLAVGETGQALAAATQAVELAPNDKELLQQLSACAQANGKYNLARESLLRLTSLYGDDPSAWLALARLAFEGDQLEQARSALATAIACDRRNVDVLLQSADLASSHHLTSTAQRLLHSAFSQQTLSEGQLRRLGAAAERLTDYDSAHQAWRLIIDRSPTDVDALDRCAQALWALHRRSAAIGLWQRALQLAPDNPQLHRMLGRALLANGEADTALIHYADALRLDSGNGELSLEAGLASLKHQDVDDALERLKTAVLLMPDNVDASLGLAECLLSLNHFEEAHTALLNVTLQGSAPSRAFSMLAVSSASTNDLSSAKAALDQAFSQPMQRDSDAIWASQAAFRLAQWDRAIDVLDRRIRRIQTPEMLGEFAAAHLRLAVLRWLYSSIAHATTHAPSLPDAKAYLGETMDQIFRRMRTVDSPAVMLDTLHRWTSLLLDESVEEAGSSTIHLDYVGDLKLARSINLIRSGRPLDAVALLNGVVSQDLLGSIAQLIKGYAHAVSNDMDKALQCYQQFADDPLHAPLASYLEALAHKTRGEDQAAIASLNNALTLWPDEDSWHFELAALYLETGQIDAALPHLQEAAELNPDCADYLHALARSLFQVGDLSHSAERFNQVIALKPEAPQVWKEAAQTALAVGEYENAEAWFERACTLLPSDADCLVGTAQALLKQGKNRLAQDRADAALRLDPSNPEALIAVGDIYSAMDKLQEALNTYDRALQRAEDPVPIHAARGRLLMKLGRFEDAVQEIRGALKSFPEHELGWQTLAELYEKNNCLEEAADAATRVVNLAPHNASFHLLLGRICRKQGHLDRAMNELLLGEKVAPANPALAMELGMVFEERRENEQAARCYERASSLEPGNPESYFRTGLLYKDMKRYDDAVAQFKQAAELAPMDADIHHQLAAVHALQLVHGFAPENVVNP